MIESERKHIRCSGPDWPGGGIMRKLMATVVVSGMLFGLAPSLWADATRLAQATGSGDKSAAPADKAPAEKPAAAPSMTGRGAARTVKVRGSVEAVDKDKGTVTL